MTLKHVLIAVFTIALMALIVTIVFTGYRAQRDMLMRTCVSSLQASTQMALEKNNLGSEIQLTDQWHALTDKEWDLVLNSVGGKFHLDCAWFDFQPFPPISVRQVGDHVEVKVDEFK
jgi:hypothetical protein